MSRAFVKEDNGELPENLVESNYSNVPFDKDLCPSRAVEIIGRLYSIESIDVTCGLDPIMQLLGNCSLASHPAVFGDVRDRQPGVT